MCSPRNSVDEWGYQSLRAIFCSASENTINKVIILALKDDECIRPVSKATFRKEIVGKKFTLISTDAEGFLENLCHVFSS